ncbi:PD-(D/E)XK nuclease family protein [Patescibacteria group bacterium]|nr:PD-(D/E)XK nuclease family protein [Patescibacteria group bacterium]
MAFNPNAVFISPSSLGDFEKCPQLYYYRSVFRSPRGLKIQIINPSLAIGACVHDTLEQFLKLSPADRLRSELFRIFEWNWKSFSGEKGGFTLKDEEELARQKASAMLERFFGNKHFLVTEAVKIPGFPKVELGNDLILTGKLDWIEKEQDTYHVIDFKTGKNEEREDSQQLPIYSLLVARLLNTDKIKTSYWYLDKDEDIRPFPSADIEETFKTIKQKGEILKLVRQTNSYRCQSGNEFCWACKDMHEVAHGKGKLVNVDPVNRKQEIYILVEEDKPVPTEEKQETISFADDLPF